MIQLNSSSWSNIKEICFKKKKQFEMLHFSGPFPWTVCYRSRTGEEEARSSSIKKGIGETH